MHCIHVNSTEKMNREKCEKTNRRSETADGDVPFRSIGSHQCSDIRKLLRKKRMRETLGLQK